MQGCVECLECEKGLVAVNQLEYCVFFAIFKRTMNHTHIQKHQKIYRVFLQIYQQKNYFCLTYNYFTISLYGDKYLHR